MRKDTLHTNNRDLWATLIALLLIVVGGVALAHGATPTTAPSTTQATTKPTAGPAVGIVCGLGSSPAIATTSTTPVYNVGACPAIGWFDARAVFGIQTDVAVWNFGDGNELYPDPKHADKPTAYPTANRGANDSLSGPVVAHWYLRSGTYHVTCRISRGSVTTGSYAITMVVGADTRKQVYFSTTGNDVDDGSAAHPWKSAAKFYAAADAGNIDIHLGHAWSGTMPATCMVGNNTVVQGDGSQTLTPSPGSPVFCGAGNNTTTGVLVVGVNFDSPGTAARTSTGQAYTAAAPGCHIATVRGTGWAFIDCELGCLDRGWDVEGVNGLLIQGCKQVKSLAIYSQVFYAQLGSRVTVTFSDFTSSVHEDPFRVTTDGSAGGGLHGLNLEFDTYAQPGMAKAPLTIRAGSDIFERNCVTLRGEHSVNVGIGNSAGAIGDTRVINGVTRDCLLDAFGGSAVGVSSTFHIDDGVIGWTMVNNDATVAPGGAGVTLSPNWSSRSTLTGIVVENLHVTGTRAVGVLINGAPPVATAANGVTSAGTAWPGMSASGVVVNATIK